MDKRAAEQYLDSLYGNAKGYAAVAYKDKGQSWQECQFAYPRDRDKLIAWAEIHHDANVFICPALRADTHTRKKGDGVALKWLWADVDWDKVPEDKRAEVNTRIRELGSLVVGSGSGNNAHVYVKLNRTVTVAEHFKLNSGLRDYLFADAKHADNSLLRLPGTTNWKTPQGAPVQVRGMTGQLVRVENLMRKRAFRDAKVTDAEVSDSDWSFVDVSGLPRRIRAMANMPSEEAVAKYGTRHKAVWAITGELHKRGLDADMIHTLMDAFPPAVEKNDDEHNGYDVHKDVNKRLALLEQDVQNAVDLEDDDFEAITEVEAEDHTVADGVKIELMRRRVRREADRIEALNRHTRPPDDTSESLQDALSMPADPVQWLIDGMASTEANVIITGQYKAGKTALMVASLIPSLVDGKDFLNHFPVSVPEGGAVVGHWNLEMSRQDIVDKYIRNAGIENVANLKLAHWRGQPMNILTEPGKDQAVEWLCTEPVNGRPAAEWVHHPEGWVQVWTIDSYAQLARMAGVNTNDNDEVYALMGAIDEIKVRANVKACFMLGHTGRNSDEKSAASGHLNATRGASAVDEHVDARWVLTKDSTNTRYLATEGRDVEPLSRCGLEFDEATKHMTLTNRTPADVAVEGNVQVVVAVLATESSAEGMNQATLVKHMRARVKLGIKHCREVIEEAIDAGFVEVKYVQGVTGGKASKMHFLTGGKPVDDPARRATPAIVDNTRSRRR
jgi:hypothetical protein